MISLFSIILSSFYKKISYAYISMTSNQSTSLLRTLKKLFFFLHLDAKMCFVVIIAQKGQMRMQLRVDLGQQDWHFFTLSFLTKQFLIQMLE